MTTTALVWLGPTEHVAHAAWMGVRGGPAVRDWPPGSVPRLSFEVQVPGGPDLEATVHGITFRGPRVDLEAVVAGRTYRSIGGQWFEPLPPLAGDPPHPPAVPGMQFRRFDVARRWEPGELAALADAVDELGAAAVVVRATISLRVDVGAAVAQLEPLAAAGDVGAGENMRALLAMAARGGRLEEVR